jgi:hypothetical protein
MEFVQPSLLTTQDLPMLEPSPANRYSVEHAERLRPTFHALTGCDLLDPTLSPDLRTRQLQIFPVGKWRR